MKKNLSAKTIKERANASDIFFFKPPTEKEVSFKTLERTKNLQNSDIFNIKNDTNNISKSGETYLFKKFSKTKYNIGNESNSYWKLPDNKIKSVISSSSKDYNILDPKSKGLYLSKEKMMIECENKKGNINYMNPFIILMLEGVFEFIMASISLIEMDPFTPFANIKCSLGLFIFLFILYTLLQVIVNIYILFLLQKIFIIMLLILLLLK